MIVLAVDVGLRVCGYVICRVDKLDIGLVKEGEVKTSSTQEFSQKLNYISEQLQKEIKNYNPQAMIIETLYSHYRHPTTLGILAQVRGVVVLLAEKNGIKIFEYSPTKARKSFLGKGNATSFQVKKMAENIVGREFVSTHTADAFSLVAAFSHTQKLKRLEMITQ
ncbi:MAG: crossover junction endodeoxyribonuclease RuvC [Candidatus Omnitrophota bacterium]|nr:crossover junction endodeoxyribonuclease RuvC [Candidatus Omnitrophota bacterium]